MGDEAGRVLVVDDDPTIRDVVARYLAQAAPGLAQSAASSPALFHQTDLLSRCTSHNLIPAGIRLVADRPPLAGPAR